MTIINLQAISWEKGLIRKSDFPLSEAKIKDLFFELGEIEEKMLSEVEKHTPSIDEDQPLEYLEIGEMLSLINDHLFKVTLLMVHLSLKSLALKDNKKSQEIFNTEDLETDFLLTPEKRIYLIAEIKNLFEIYLSDKKPSSLEKLKECVSILWQDYNNYSIKMHLNKESAMDKAFLYYGQNLSLKDYLK